MGQVAKNRYEYLHYDTESIVEGSEWQVPDVITLRDAAGVVIPSSQMATMTLTLQDWSDPTHPIVNGVDGTVDVKNARSCTLSTQGIFKLVLLKEDTIILNDARSYEIKRVMVEYQWPAVPTKSDALEIFIIVRNLERRPYVSP
jgi:hypothetical protein